MAAIRLAIVDDSTFVRKALARILEKEPRIRLTGVAASGEELLANLGTWRPEVITLDLNMPGMGGLATLDRIKAWRDVPVIILSTHSRKDAPLTIEALHRGAVDFIDKQQYSMVDFESLRAVLVEKILHVTGHTACTASTPPASDLARPLPPRRDGPPPPEGGFDLVVAGASTGGPPALQQILQNLHTPFPVPIVIVQHMPPGFTTAFANRLDAHLPFTVKEPAHGERLAPGSVYIAAAGAHLHIDRSDHHLVAKVTRFPEQASHRPSVDILFDSAAALAGRSTTVLAILLTGMGKDGAVGLSRLAASGAHTIIQDEATCVVYGMPKAAKDLCEAHEELPLPAIARRIDELLAGDRARQAGTPT